MKAIDLQNTSLSHGSVNVLDHVYLSVELGEMLYLVGKSGEGKSTFIKTLIGDIPLLGERAEVLGYDLLSLDRLERSSLRRKIGVIFQDFQLLTDRSVEGNLDFVLTATGWKAESSKVQRMEEVLAQVGLEGKQKDMPHRLSGGEQQRLSVARALLNKPSLVLADEPTGQLDPESSEEILKLLVEIHQNGTAMIISTHDYLTIDRFPARVVRCAGGALTDLGGILFESPNKGQAGYSSKQSEAQSADFLSDPTPGD